MKTRLIIFNKPYNVLSQFTDAENRDTLAKFIDQPGYYVAGRLDRDSEGLMLLTNDGKLQHKISHPKFKTWKTYWVQIEGIPSDEALEQLRKGVVLKDGKTLPAKVKRIDEPENLWPRDPPVRFRKHIPTSWIQLSIREGKNRQVRRMTAAVGFPTLRLVRYSIGKLNIDSLETGKWKFADEKKLFPDAIKKKP